MRLLVTVLLLASLILVALAQAKIVLTVRVVMHWVPSDNRTYPIVDAPVWIDGVVYRTNSNGTVQIEVNPGIHIVLVPRVVNATVIEHGELVDYVYVLNVSFWKWTWLNYSSPFQDVAYNITRNITFVAHYVHYVPSQGAITPVNVTAGVKIIVVPHFKIESPRLQKWVISHEWATTVMTLGLQNTSSGTLYYEGITALKFMDMDTHSEVTVPMAVVAVQQLESGSCLVEFYRYNVLVKRKFLVEGEVAYATNITRVYVDCVDTAVPPTMPEEKDRIVIFYPKEFESGIYMYRFVEKKWISGTVWDAVYYVKDKINPYVFRFADWLHIDMYDLAYHSPDWVPKCDYPILVAIVPGHYVSRFAVPVLGGYHLPESSEPFMENFNLSAIGYLYGSPVNMFMIASTGFDFYASWYRRLDIGVLYGNTTSIDYPHLVHVAYIYDVLRKITPSTPASAGYTYKWRGVLCGIDDQCIGIVTRGSVIRFGRYWALDRPDLYYHVTARVNGTWLFIYRSYTRCNGVWCETYGDFLLLDANGHVLFRVTKEDMVPVLANGTAYVLNLEVARKFLGNNRKAQCITPVFPPFLKYRRAYIWPVLAVELTDMAGRALHVPVNATVLTPRVMLNVSNTAHVAVQAPAYQHAMIVTLALGQLISNITVKVNDTEPIQIVHAETPILQVKDYRNTTRAFIFPQGVKYTVTQQLQYGKTSIALTGRGISCFSVYFERKPTAVKVTASTRDVVWGWHRNYLRVCTYLHSTVTVNLTDQYYLTVRLVDLLGHVLAENITLVDVGVHSVSAPMNYSGFLFAFWQDGLRKPNRTVLVLNDTTLVAYYKVPTIITASAVYTTHNKTHVMLEVTGILADIYGDRISNATITVALKINNTVVNVKEVETDMNGVFHVKWIVDKDTVKWTRVAISYNGSDIYVGSTVQVKPTPSLIMYLHQLLIIAIVVAILIAIALVLKHLTERRTTKR